MNMLVDTYYGINNSQFSALFNVISSKRKNDAKKII